MDNIEKRALIALLRHQIDAFELTLNKLAGEGVFDRGAYDEVWHTAALEQLGRLSVVVDERRALD